MHSGHTYKMTVNDYNISSVKTERLAVSLRKVSTVTEFCRSRLDIVADPLIH